MIKLGVLISGSGSNLQAIIDAIEAGTLDARIVTVISNKADAYGLERACNAGIRAVWINPADAVTWDAFSSPDSRTFGRAHSLREWISPEPGEPEVSPDSPSASEKRSPATASEYNSALLAELRGQGADYVVMAGYMKLLGAEVLDAYPMRVLNLHPALLPSFPGAHGIDDALAYGVKVTGITVHFADEEFDRGPIIAQTAVEVREDDTVDTLAERIHAAEHELYPKVLQWIATGRLTIEGRRVHVSSE